MKRVRFFTQFIVCVLVLVFAFSGLATAEAAQTDWDTTDLKIVSLANASVGDVVLFGHYEQDCDLANGKEPVEWIVLYNNRGRALLLSRYGLDAQPFHTENAEVTWRTCSLRRWLNREFLSACFNREEQSRILRRTVTATGNWKYPHVAPGNNTKDRVFLLSMKEARDLSWFENPEYVNHKLREELRNPRRLCEATEYAKEQGAYVGKEGTSYWWLRTPGPNLMHAAYINTDGSIFGGGMVFHTDGVVRPAIWVSTQSGGSVQTDDDSTQSFGTSSDWPTTKQGHFSATAGQWDYDDGLEDLEDLFEEFMESFYEEGDDPLESFEEFLEMNDIDLDQYEDYEEYLEEYIQGIEEERDEYDILIDDDYDDLIDDYPNDYPDEEFYEDYWEFYGEDYYDEYIYDEDFDDEDYYDDGYYDDGWDYYGGWDYYDSGDYYGGWDYYD